MVLKNLWCLLLVAGITCLGIPIKAQQTLAEYGKNRVQYKNFNWQFYSSDNFDVYFYEGGKQNARRAAEYLEGEYDRITQDVLGYALYSKANTKLEHFTAFVIQNTTLLPLSCPYNSVIKIAILTITSSMTQYK